MRTIGISMAVCAIATAWMTPQLHAQAAPTIQAALAKEAGTLSDKFAGLGL